MTKTATDLKFYLNDELEAVLMKVKHIEDLTNLNIGSKQDRTKIMESLKQLEADIDAVQRTIGETI